MVKLISNLIPIYLSTSSLNLDVFVCLIDLIDKILKLVLPFQFLYVESIDGNCGTLNIVLAGQQVLENFQWFIAAKNFVNFNYSIQITIERLFSFSSLNQLKQVLVSAELI